jgi:hypothetical protein
MAREVVRIEFQPGQVERVLEAMADITVAGDGWINLLPGIDEEDAPPQPTGLSALLAPRLGGAVMGTWTPQVQGKRGTEGASVGLMHPAGRFAARRLAGLGAPVPDGWLIRQDHARRGLILQASVGAAHSEIANWIVAAGTALNTLPTTGEWRADVYLPKPQKDST